MGGARRSAPTRAFAELIGANRKLLEATLGHIRRLEQDIATLKPGDFFGEMSLIFDNPTSASVMTAEPSELFMFMKSDFWYTLDGNTELQDQIRKIAEQRRKG